MKLFLLFIVVLIFPTIIFAQTPNTKAPIEVEYNFFCNTYTIGSQEYSKGEIADTLKTNPLSASFAKAYTKNINLAYLFFVAEGFAILKFMDYKDDHTQSANDKAYYSFGVALILDIISISLFISANNSFEKAIRNYNRSLEKTSYKNSGEIKLNLALNRLMLSYTF